MTAAIAMSSNSNSNSNGTTSSNSSSSNHSKDRAVVQRNENAELRQSLLQLQERQQGLQHECNFYRVKVSELNEILKLKASDGDDGKKAYSEWAVAKSLQSAELSMEVIRLEQELQQAKNLNQKLSEQREQNKRLLLDLSGIVKALQSVPVDYERSETTKFKDHKTSQNVSLENVKAKVDTIMEDRRLLVLRCQELEKENNEKDDKLTSLEAQFHLLNSMNFAKGDGGVGNDASSSMEALMSIDRTSSNVSASSKTSITTTESTIEPQEPKITTDMTVIRSVSNLLLSTKEALLEDSASCATKSTAPSMSETTTSPSSSRASQSSSPVKRCDTHVASDEIQRLQAALEESNQRYVHFKDLCQSAFAKMKAVEFECTQVKDECEQAKTKSDTFKAHLKDVIDQYKELNQEYDRVLGNLEDAKYEIRYLEKCVRELEEEREHLEQYGNDILENEGLADNVEILKAAYLTARATMQSLQEKLATAEHEAEEAEKRRANGGRQYRDTVAQCRKLQHEVKILETRVSNAEEEVLVAKKETQKYKEEAKQTRRRLTLMAKKDGTALPPTDSVPVATPRNSLMLPEHIMVPSLPNLEDFISCSDQQQEQHRVLLKEAIIAGKAMSQKQQLIHERDQLLSENSELKAFCDEILEDTAMAD